MRSRQNDTWFIFSFILCSHHFFRFSSTSYKINSISMHSFQLSIMTSHHIVLLIWNIRQNLDLKQYLHYSSLSATSTSLLFLISFYWYDKEIACYLFLWLKVWVWPHLNRIFSLFSNTKTQTTSARALHSPPHFSHFIALCLWRSENSPENELIAFLNFRHVPQHYDLSRSVLEGTGCARRTIWIFSRCHKKSFWYIPTRNFLSPRI